MTTNLLRNKPLPIPRQNRINNIENGNDAEVLSASVLLKALGAEISWASRNEDGRKIDLICSYDHPWFEKERLIFFVQVKSGAAYGTLIPNGFRLLTDAKKAAQRTSHSICIIWVERNTNQTFWAYIHPFSTTASQNYSDYHKISPATKFDIARCQTKTIPVNENLKGLIIKSLFGDTKQKRKHSSNHYKRLQKLSIINPNLGKVEITRVGWRHMFRKQRSQSNKEKSLQVIPYLDKLLPNKPSKIYISKYETEIINEYEYRTCEYVLMYEKVKINIDKQIEEKTAIIRVIEETRWPTDWQNNSMLSQCIERRLVLLNSYYK